MVSYKRRRKVNPNDKSSCVNFTDEVGDAWEEYHVFLHNFKTWLKIKGYNADEVATLPEEELNAIIKESPYYQATANDVNWVNKVKMQGAIQKWVDHSICVTVYVPEDISEEMVGKIYLTGWESGCKGITVYCDGSSFGVLVKDDKNKKEE